MSQIQDNRQDNSQENSQDNRQDNSQDNSQDKETGQGDRTRRQDKETGPIVFSVSTTLFHARQPRKGAQCVKYRNCPLRRERPAHRHKYINVALTALLLRYLNTCDTFEMPRLNFEKYK